MMVPVDSSSRSPGDTISSPDQGNARVKARVRRRDATLRRATEEKERAKLASERAVAVARRSEAAVRRAEVSRQLAQHARERFDGLTSLLNHPDWETGECERLLDERDRLADQRETEADERDRAADWRERNADERDRMADQREREADQRDRVADQLEVRTRYPAEDSDARLASLASSSMRLRGDQARLLSQVADLADQIAYEAEAFAGVMEISAERGDRERRLATAATERTVASRARENALRWRAESEASEQGAN
jgi:hypothetical protein